MIFPEVKGSNLEKKKYKIPQDLEGTINIVTVAFQQWHQGLVNTWVPFLEELKQTHTEIYFYEFPTINRGYKGMRFIIDGGMRMGIPDKEIRDRTITLYLDKKKFMQNLTIENDEDIITYVLNNKGEIFTKIEGEYTSEKGNKIKSRVEELLK
ncbi:MAG: hypothetical protein HGN29_13535 [Asgard group archaeon]|nr:hypothetical protein [Asgard group archaeon]